MDGLCILVQYFYHLLKKISSNVQLAMLVCAVFCVGIMHGNSISPNPIQNSKLGLGNLGVCLKSITVSVTVTVSPSPILTLDWGLLEVGKTGLVLGFGNWTSV